MKKRIFALILALMMTVLALAGCDEDEQSGTNADTPHVHEPVDEGKYDSTDKSTHSYICKGCGETIVEEHVYKLFFTVNGHYYGCDCHYADGELQEHSLEDGKCTVCGYAEDGDHKHDFSMYSCETDTYHLKMCSCGASEKEDHVLSWVIDSWSHFQKCPCGYTTKQESHKYDENGKCTVCVQQGHVCSYNDTPDRYDDEYHYFYCKDENCEDYTGVSHRIDYDVYYADGDVHYHACECGYREGEQPHVYDNGVFISDCACGSKLPESRDLQYELYGDSYTLVGIGSCKDKYIVVPQMHNGKPVTAVGASAFEGNTSIVYVSLHDNIRSIGSSAFAGCASLKAVNIPECITEIKDNTFAACRSLVAVNAPDSLEKVGMFAFTGCESFKGFRNDMTKNEVSTQVFTHIKAIEDNAFTDCSSLEGKLELYVCESIGNQAFSGCASLKSVELYELTLLGGDAFNGCKSLNTVCLESEQLLELNEGWGFDVGTFGNCSSLKSITVIGPMDWWLDFFANSVVDEEMGLSWYKNTPDFVVEFTDLGDSGEFEVCERKKISDLYAYIDETYWQ